MSQGVPVKACDGELSGGGGGVCGLPSPLDAALPLPSALGHMVAINHYSSRTITQQAETENK